MICDGIIMIHINILRVVSFYRLTKARWYHIPVPSQIMRDPKFIVNMHNKFENDLKYISYWSVCDLMCFKYSNFLHRSVSLVWGLPMLSGRHLEVSERYWMIMGIHNTLRSIYHTDVTEYADRQLHILLLFKLTQTNSTEYA